MADVRTDESWLAASNKQRLYTKTWHAATTPPKARLVFVHGFSDHCNFYGTLFPSLAQLGVKVYAFDQRGWGRSVQEPRQKGLTGPTSLVMQDITSVITSVLDKLEEKTVPLFLMGHSMGGAEVLTYAATGPSNTVSKIRGFLAEAPFIALHPDAKPWKATVAIGRLASRVLPHRQMLQKLDSRKLCRDSDVCKAWEADPLCHDTGTLEGLAGMLDRAVDLEEGRVIVRDGVGDGEKTRLWVGHGTADGICGYEVCRQWYETVQVEDKQMRVYEGWFHKLHAEPGEAKVQFAEDVTNWMLDRCDLGEVTHDAEARAKL